jgi:hypothetical protein
MTFFRKTLSYGLASLLFVFVGSLGEVKGTQQTSGISCNSSMSSSPSDTGISFVQIGVRASATENSSYKIMGSDLFLISDLSTAFAATIPASPYLQNTQLTISKVQSMAFGVAVVYGQRPGADTSQILCSLLFASKTDHIGPLDTNQQPDFSQLIFQNANGTSFNQIASETSVAVGINSSNLLIRNNQGNIQIGVNVVRGQESEESFGEFNNNPTIRIEGNTGSISILSNFAKIEILNNNGDILIQHNRPTGEIDVKENAGAVRVVENQGKVNDSTNTVIFGEGS